MKLPSFTVARCAAVVAVFGYFTATLASAAAASPHPGVPPRTAGPGIEVLELNLRNALFQKEAPTGRDADLILELERVDGQWLSVIGVAREYNCSLHLGYVKEARVHEHAIELDLGMRIVADSWVPGGPAHFRVKLALQEDGSLSGAFEGLFKEKATAGVATGSRFVPRQVLGDDFVAVSAGEHPRTVFRKHDLARLREKLRTPFGQAAFAQMTGPVGWGVQYQLTGDPQYADRARAEVAEIIFKGKGCTAAFAPARALGVQVERVAVSLDFCFEAWPAEFKQQVVTWLRKIATRVFSDGRKISLSANWHVASNHAGSLYAGVAFAGLVLWGEPGPEPPRPTPPFLETNLPPATDFQPGRGVPVVPLTPGRVPDQWLITQVLPESVSTDPMTSAQGLEALRPAPGSAVQWEQFKLTFQPMKPEWFDATTNSFDMKRLMNNLDTASFVVHTVLEVREPGLYRWVCPFSNSGRTQAIVHGRRLAHGQVVRLEKGWYPLTILARVLTVWNLFQPRFETATEADLPASARVLAQAHAEYEARLAEWKADLAEWRRLGGTDVENYKLFRAGRRMMYLHYREAIGTGGFQAEVSHYNKDATDGPNRYAAAFRRCFGYDVSPHPDITHYLARHVFVHIYPDRGRPWAQDINGSVKIGGDYFAALFPITPEPWKPAMLWAWNRLTGVTSDASRARAIADDPAWGFAHYPLNLAPQPPAGVLPLAWQAPDYGFYAFRNAYQGADDIVCQVFLKAHHIGGWNGPNAGTFRIAGLGKTWAVGPEGRERRRWHESVVWLPNDSHREGACGRLTALQTAPDGSGVVTVDLNDVYSKESSERLYALYGGARNDWAFEPSGISGMRSLAVDYSGACGAPALFAVVDSVRGGQDKVWLWQVPRVGNERDLKMADVRIEGNTFTIRQDDATLRATFITPAAVKLHAGTKAMKLRKSAGHEAGKIEEVTFDAVFAEGGEDYFVVATLQRGAAPPVAVEGNGLNARATVGRRMVRFDGKQILVEEK